MWSWQADAMLKPRHVFALVFVAACWASIGRYAALAGLLLVAGPVLLLGGGLDKVSGARRRVSMTQVAGPSRFYPCTYCGRPADSWDHVMPWSRGGSDRQVVPACTQCNSSKNDSTPEEWWARIGNGAPMPAHWPRTGVTQ